MTISVETSILIVAICAIITLIERALPFLIFRGGNAPKLIKYLGNVIPIAIMATLIIYTLKDISFNAEPKYIYPKLIASIVTILLHLWRKNTLLSIFIGTLTCMLLMQFAFK